MQNKSLLLPTVNFRFFFLRMDTDLVESMSADLFESTRVSVSLSEKPNPKLLTQPQAPSHSLTPI